MTSVMDSLSKHSLVPATWIASLALHALVLVPFAITASSAVQQRDIYDDGAGQDAFKVVIEPVLAQVEMEAVAPPVVEKPVEPELKTAITARSSPGELERLDDVPPPMAAVAALAQEETPSATYDGGKASLKATMLTAYVNNIHSALRNVKLTRRVKGSGQVWIGFTIDSGGHVKSPEVLRSSGSPAIDRAAVEMLAKASFPPLPDALGSQEYFKLPFTFSS